MKPAVGWSAQDIVRITGGSWLAAPTAADWSALGVCADASQFSPGQMLLAPSRGAVKVINDYDVTGGKTGTLLPGCHHVAIVSEAPNGDHIVTAIMSAPDQLSLYTDLRSTLDAVKRGRDWPKPA